MSSPAPGAATAYERGSQAFLISAASGVVTQTGRAAPAAAKVFGVTPTVSRGQLPTSVAVQIDINGTGSIAGGSAQLLGSLDGINFYPIGSAISFSGAAGTSGILVFVSSVTIRYLTAAITAMTPTLSPTVDISFSI